MRRHRPVPAMRNRQPRMRGWPGRSGAQPPLDPRAALGARHLGLFPGEDPAGHGIGRLNRLATESNLDPRDLESGLVRLVLAHHHRMASCRGGRTCHVLGTRIKPE
jgi:hypothetical protein